MATYLEQIRSLPSAEAGTLLDALLDRMWVNGALAGRCERDGLQAEYFDRHVDTRRREASAVIDALLRTKVVIEPPASIEQRQKNPNNQNLEGCKP